MATTKPSHEYIQAGALMQCDKGTLPCQLSVPPRSPTVGGRPWCNTNDRDPIINQFNFGVCALTQKPCLLTCRPLQWQDVQTSVDVAGRPALLDKSSILCAMGGRITFLTSGQLA